MSPCFYLTFNYLGTDDIIQTEYISLRVPFGLADQTKR